MNGQQTTYTPDREAKAVLFLPAAIALWFLNGYAFQYFTLDRDRFGIYWPRHEWLYVHVIAGTIAILLGPLQFWLGLHRREKLLHSILGSFYVFSVFIAAGAALYLARHTDFGWVFGLGLTAMSLVWIVSTAFATISIYLRLVQQHREWMVRSYILTFGFVTFRAFTELLQVAGIGSTLEQMTAASWFSWSVPLLAAEFIIQGRKIFAARRLRISHKEEESRKSLQIGLFDSVPF